MTEAIKILAVDDSDDDRLLYRRVLKKSALAPCELVEADNGETGLLLIHKEMPACVLLDYSLPGHNGIEVLKRIRSKHPFVPVVMLTGQGNENIAVAAMQEGAQNYIAKAVITPESLQRVIQVAIEHCALQKRIHEQRSSLEIFTRALAHDLKEPVRTIRSFLDLFIAQESLSETGGKYFHYIRNAADRMSMLIETVFLYTQLDDPGRQIARELCDADKTLEDVKENLGQLIRERGAVITSGPLPTVFTNRIQLIQVLQNLISNAISHCQQTPAIHISAEEKTDRWLFTVADNGPGVDQEHREKIFEPFKRVAHLKEQGLGLGLAICRKIVESCGGKIWCEARPEGGTLFSFTLPREAVAAAEAQPLPLENKVQEQRPEIAGQAKPEGKPLANLLLVEDNEADIELTKIILIERNRLRCNLLVAHDGYEALALLRAETDKTANVDLILLDINMPRMDGFELLGRMRTEEKMRRIPVIMCTTSTYGKDMEKAKALGAIGYITKPAALEALKPIVENIVSLQLCQEKEGYSILSK